MSDYVYTEDDGFNLVRFLAQNGINAKLIGSLPSQHDIDIVVKDDEVNKTARVLMYRKMVKTDLGTLFVVSSHFGHVDIFGQSLYNELSKENIKNLYLEKFDWMKLRFDIFRELPKSPFGFECPYCHEENTEDEGAKEQALLFINGIDAETHQGMEVEEYHWLELMVCWNCKKAFLVECESP